VRFTEKAAVWCIYLASAGKNPTYYRYFRQLYIQFKSIWS